MKKNSKTDMNKRAAWIGGLIVSFSREIEEVRQAFLANPQLPVAVAFSPALLVDPSSPPETVSVEVTEEAILIVDKSVEPLGSRPCVMIGTVASSHPSFGGSGFWTEAL